MFRHHGMMSLGQAALATVAYLNSDLYAHTMAMPERHDLNKIKAAGVQLRLSAHSLVQEGIDFDELDDEELAQSTPHRQTKREWQLFKQALSILKPFYATEFPGLPGQPANDPSVRAITSFTKNALPVPFFVCLVRYTILLPDADPFSTWRTQDGAVYTNEQVRALRFAAKMEIFAACRDLVDLPHELLLQVAKNLPHAQYVCRVTAAAVLSAMKKKVSSK
jgi:hypothetical protein